MSGKLETWVRELGDTDDQEVCYQDVSIEEAVKQFARYRFSLADAIGESHKLTSQKQLYVIARRGACRWSMTVLRKEMIVVNGLRGD